jgi:ABC-type multidrug transport system fused ATPase/permease subunit
VSLFTFQGVLSGLILILEFLVVIGVGALLLIIEPKGTMVAVILAVLAAWIFHVLTKAKVSKWGQMRQETEGQRIQLIQQGLAGVKEIKLGGKEKNFLDGYQVHNIVSARIGYLNHAMQQMPKLWLELLAIFILIGLVITMVSQGKPMDAIFPVLGVFAIAAFRLLPSISRILVSLQSLRFGLPIIDVLYREINLPLQENLFSEYLPNLQNNVEVKGVTFFYPETSSPSINNVTMKVGKGQMVGIVGQSGSGKSTLIDLILGLLKPGSGRILCDGVDIAKNLKGWQSQIGYVPQSIYLTDDSIRCNIALGLRDDEIDDQKIRTAIKAAQLDNFINALPDGLETLVGERGVRISGGQRQRIGIARALYYNPEILVLDEATSSLDVVMAKEVMNAVEKMRGERTILIVAHQIATIKNCDQIYFLESGVLADSGKFEDLYCSGSDGTPVRIIK